MKSLSSVEGHLLALIWRFEPTTAYFVRKSLESSLASDVSGSPGAVYPALQRLKDRGFLTAVSAPDDGRRTEWISLTAQGGVMARKWVTELATSDQLPQDPLRTKIAFADLLDPEEARHWLIEAQALLVTELEQLEAANAIDQPLATALAFDNAISLTSARIAWLDRAVTRLRDDKAGS